MYSVRFVKLLWADYDGRQVPVTLSDLRADLAAQRLPPFVLVWQSGWLEWIPAYMVGELQSALGLEMDHFDVPNDDAQDDPPEVPLEWYVECLGGPPSAPFRRATDPGVRRSLELDWSEGFSIHESPTLRAGQIRIPLGAFRDVEEYLAHMRRLKRR